MSLYSLSKKYLKTPSSIFSQMLCPLPWVNISGYATDMCVSTGVFVGIIVVLCENDFRSDVCKADMNKNALNRKCASGEYIRQGRTSNKTFYQNVQVT